MSSGVTKRGRRGRAPFKVNELRRWQAQEAAVRGRRSPDASAPSRAEIRDLDLYEHITPDVEPFPGAVAIAQVQMDGYAPKGRPVVLVESRRSGEAWTAWCLTTKTTFTNGLPRPVAVGVERVGVLGGTHLWNTAVEVPSARVDGVIWAAPFELLLSAALADYRMPGGEDARRGLACRLHAGLVAAGWYWPKPRG